MKKKGHKNYNTSTDPQKNGGAYGHLGGAFGYLGKPQNAYTSEELHALGKELIDFMNEPRSIWYKGFCNRKGFSEDHFKYLKVTYPVFAEYAKQAKQIQQEKIVTHSFWKEGDSNFGKFILARHHEGWEETPEQTNQHITYNVNYASPEQVLPQTLPTTDSSSS